MRSASNQPTIDNNLPTLGFKRPPTTVPSEHTQTGRPIVRVKQNKQAQTTCICVQLQP